MLYIDRDPYSYRGWENQMKEEARQDFILRRLGEFYDVCVGYNFYSTFVDERFSDCDALISHLPQQGVKVSYDLALQRLSFLIEKQCEKKVVVYTGADPLILGDDTLRSIRVGCVVRKRTDRFQEDWKNLFLCLKDLIGW